ncbi:MAG TPA: hypothetical protein VFQ61_09555 [Polyangiaceae bacterium]|nr:hypothetical protein [Polyangiaceae bacterium]
MKKNVMSGPAASAHEIQWVDSTRASRSRVKYRELRRLGRMGDGQESGSTFSAALLLFGDQILSVGERTLAFNRRSGAVVWVKEGGWPRAALVGERVAYPCGTPVLQSGQEENEQLLFRNSVREWGRVRRGHAILVSQYPTNRHEGINATVLVVRRAIVSDVDTPDPEGYGDAGYVFKDAYVSAAIFDSGDVVLVARDGRFVILDAAGQKKMVVRKQGQLGFRSYDLSVGAEHMALLEAPESWTDSDLDDAEPRPLAELSPDPVPPIPPPPPQWTTGLRVLNLEGRELQRASVPIAVVEPPIDGGEGRFWLAGYGLALVERGQVVFAQRSEHLFLGTAFASGELALSAYNQVQILSKSGAVLQAFRVPKGEHLTSAPTIDDDGSVWVTTNRGIYVAR